MSKNVDDTIEPRLAHANQNNIPMKTIISRFIGGFIGGLF